MLSGEMSFAQFEIGCLPYYWILRIFIYLQDISLEIYIYISNSRVMSWIYQIFSANLWLAFHSFNNVFHEAEVFNFNEIQHVILSFIDFDFGGISKAYCQAQDHVDFFLRYLLEVLYFGT